MYKREPICVERKIIWLFLAFPAEVMKMSEPLLSMLQIPEIMIFAILKDSLHIQERSLGSRYNSYDRTITFSTVEKNGVPYIRYTESDRQYVSSDSKKFEVKKATARSGKPYFLRTGTSVRLLRKSIPEQSIKRTIRRLPDFTGQTL